MIADPERVCFNGRLGRDGVAFVAGQQGPEQTSPAGGVDSLAPMRSVDVIAERVGYADATHFIRLFRRAHGVTPTAYRADHHGPSSPGTPVRRPSEPR